MAKKKDKQQTAPDAGEAVVETQEAPMELPEDLTDEERHILTSMQAEEEPQGFLARMQYRRRIERARKLGAKDDTKQLRGQAKQLLKEAKAREKRQQDMARHMMRVSSHAAELGYDAERPITAIPRLPDHASEVEFIVVEEDRAFIRVFFDERTSQHIYEVIEPQLMPHESRLRDFIRDTLVRTLDARSHDGRDPSEALREAVDEIIVDHDVMLDLISKERILYHLTRDFLGYGPIDVMMRDGMLEDVSCNGPELPVYVFHRKYESIKSSVTFRDETDLDRFVIGLAQRSGKHISIADPVLDATLPDGSRLQATLSREVTSRGSSFTIRKFRADPLTPPDLINYRTLDVPMAAYFWLLMEEGRSMIYAGGTASGKTTSLNAWCQFIPPEKKIVSIEDTREVNILHENWIAGVTRSGFGQETASGKMAGAVDMYRLLEAALRQRPEYLLVGEVRGKEALTLFQAMATGHAVYSTMHADSVRSAVYRLENPPIHVPRLMLQTLDVMCIQTQVRVGGKMVRRLKEVVEFVGFDPDTDDLLTNTVFNWDQVSDRHVFTGHSNIFDEIQAKKGWTTEEMLDEWYRRITTLSWMMANNVREFERVAAILQEYYRRPDRLLAKIEETGFKVERDQMLDFDHSNWEPERLSPDEEDPGDPLASVLDANAHIPDRTAMPEGHDHEASSLTDLADRPGPQELVTEHEAEELMEAEAAAKKAQAAEDDAAKEDEVEEEAT